MEYGLAGERVRRGKGKGRLRVGYKTNRQPFTSQQSAALKLSKALETYPDLTKETRDYYRDRLSTMETLPHMYMPTLAAAVVVYHRTGGQLSPELFKRENLETTGVGQLLRNLISAEAQERNPRELDDVVNKYLQSIFRYTRALTYHLAEPTVV